MRFMRSLGAAAARCSEGSARHAGGAHATGYAAGTFPWGSGGWH